MYISGLSALNIDTDIEYITAIAVDIAAGVAAVGTCNVRQIKTPQNVKWQVACAAAAGWEEAAGGHKTHLF